MFENYKSLIYFTRIIIFFFSLSVEYESTDARIENKPKMEKRYLQCPAAVTINHLEKLLRNKYSISPAMSIEIKYKKHSLSHQLSLMDVVYIYGWQRVSCI